jgi:hypothetical protein
MVVLGEFVERVSIRQENVPWGVSEGHTAYLSVEANAIARAAILGTGDVDLEIVTRSLISTAAGPLAQAKYMGAPGLRSVPLDWTLFGGERDLQAAIRLLNAAGDRLGVPDLDDVVSEARELLDVPETWEAVERVANELLRYRELGFLEIRAAVWGFVEERR